MLLDSTGAAKESYGYTACGSPNAKITAKASGFSPNSVPTNPVRFQGKRFDSGSGSYDMGARRYSATTGRWLSQDIYYGALDNLGLSQDPLTANRYAFLGANPINYVEADGHSSAWDSFIHTGGNFVRGVSDGTRQLAGAAVDTMPGIGTYRQIRAGIAFWRHPIASLKAIPHTVAHPLEQEYKKHGLAGVDGYGVPLALGFLATRGESALGEAESEAEVTVSRSRFPESAAHIEDAQAAGKPSLLTVDRAGVALRRQQALRGMARVAGQDRDEYPPAMFEEGGDGASVRSVARGDNRGAGASIALQCRSVPNGKKVRISVCP